MAMEDRGHFGEVLKSALEKHSGKSDIQIRLDVHHHGEAGSSDSAVMAKLDEVLTGIQQIIAKETEMANEMAALTAEVERNTSVDQSIITLVEGLAAQIEQLKNDPAALQALADKLRADNDTLAAAVVAHTPTAPPTEPPAGRR